MLRRQSIGQEGASAEFCDLSGRGLSTTQVERSLRVFDTAVAIDMSNNELEQIPSTIPRDLLALDVSFNLLAHAHGLERLTMLQELHLGYNRLCDVSILECCPLLQRVNLSGNRLATTRGLEALVHLISLDLSDNLIEYPEALRALSLNRNLTHLTIRGNPIAHKAAIDCRIVVLDMIPSVLILDDKKIRAKCKQAETALSAAATKSLSYSRIYDDKKQFVIRNQQTRRTPATRPAPVLLGDPTVPPKYEGNTIFIQSPRATTVSQDLSVPYPQTDRAPSSLAVPTPAPPNATSLRLASSTTAPPGAPYMSLYDRLAAANGITKRPPHDEALVGNQAVSSEKASKQNASKQPRRDRDHRDSGPSSKAKNSQMPGQRRPTAETRPPSRGNTQSRPQTPAIQHSTAPPRSPQPFTNSYRQAALAPRPPSPPPPPASHSSQYQGSTAPSPAPPSHATPAAPPLDPKQQNVLSVIQNLIQHKKQTLATLARQSSANNTAPVYSS